MKDPTNNFDSLRLIFAVLVIFSHAFPLGRGSNATEPLFALTHGQTTFGDISVWGFFVISGYLITQSWVRSPSPVKFLKRRVSRIYPGFVVASLVGAYLIVPFVADAHTHFLVSPYNFFVNTIRLQIFETPPLFTKNVYPNVLNGSLWSVPFEFWCYLGVLLLGVCRLLSRRYFVLAVFLIVIGWHLSMDITGWNPGGKLLGQIFGYPLFWATVLPFFLAGSLFQLFGGHKLLRRPLLLVAGLALGVSYLLPHGVIVAMPTCGAYLLMGLAYLPALHPLHLGRYGDFSYGVYLYAFPIQQLVVMWAGGSMAPWSLFAAATLLSLAAGALSWFFVERRFLSRPAALKLEGKAETIIEKSA